MTPEQVSANLEMPLGGPAEAAGGCPLTDLSASRQAIALHYDTNNDFFRLWLDPETMAYSCALYADEVEPGSEELERVQRRKIDFYLCRAGAAGAERVLDVGCGWGGALRRALQLGAREAIGLTLSEAQADFIESRPQPGLRVLREGWAEHAPEQPYDAIVSVEAFEAFARLGLPEDRKALVYRSFFERCWRWLRPGGCVGLQTIAYSNADAGDFDDFIATEIFPESDLPHLHELALAWQRLFEVVVLRNDRLHYVATLYDWLARLKARRAEALALVGEKTVVRFERYLRLSAFMFETGNCALYRVILRRIDQPRRAS
jgi:cyclopropane-fatty-acyl-phospholipid synthase